MKNHRLKLNLESLGFKKESVIGFAPLTVFIGRNGEGKTRTLRLLLEKLDRYQKQKIELSRRDVYTFPAERTALATLNLGHPAAQPTKDPLINNGLKILTTIASGRERHDSNKVYVRLARFLEKEILSARIGYNFQKKQLLFYQVSNDKPIETNGVPSIVKELSLLTIYLRHLAKRNDLLMIENPETGLHPMAQVQIAEFLAMLVNCGLHIIVTTHSPYIVDYLGNLMQASKNKSPQKVQKLFYLERTEAFILQDKVSIYLFEDNTVRNALNKEGTIDWGTFSEVSDDVSRIFVELL